MNDRLTLVLDALTTLVPTVTRVVDEPVLATSPSHRLTLAELPSGNVRFVYDLQMGGEWYALSTVELAPGRLFWSGVVSVARLYCGFWSELSDRLVGGQLVVTLPGADSLTQERALEETVAKRSRGGMDGLRVRSRGSAKPRSLPKEEVSHEDDDVTLLLD